MFFTTIGKIVSILVLVLGILMIATGVIQANRVLEVTSDTKWWSDRLIERGSYLITASIVLGIFTEISSSLRGISKNT